MTDDKLRELVYHVTYGTEEIKRLRAVVDKLRKGIDAASDLIDNSAGVTGLHLNGDDAPWVSLRTGGHFEEWLLAFDEATEAVKEEDKS